MSNFPCIEYTCLGLETTSRIFRKHGRFAREINANFPATRFGDSVLSIKRTYKPQCTLVTLGNFRNYWNPMITRLLHDVSVDRRWNVFAKEASVFRQKGRIINPLPRSTYWVSLFKYQILVLVGTMYSAT